MSAPAVSIVVVAFEMERELPRTVLSLAPPYQRGVAPGAVEIVVVDNGSRRPVPEETLRAAAGEARLVSLACSAPTPSPARALNEGIAAARAPFVGLWIDGARLASPGLLAAALDVHALDPTAVVATLGFHLGPKPQALSVKEGYDAAAEDALLDGIGWPAGGDRLFEIASLALSARHGWFAPLPESNGLFLPPATLAAVGGADEAFRSPGGGLVNHDLMIRAAAAAGGNVVTLLGEGTFHQVHGGVSTNAPTSPFPAFAAEYEALRGHPYRRAAYEPRLYGRMPAAALRFCRVEGAQ